MEYHDNVTSINQTNATLFFNFTSFDEPLNSNKTSNDTLSTTPIVITILANLTQNIQVPSSNLPTYFPNTMKNQVLTTDSSTVSSNMIYLIIGVSVVGCCFIWMCIQYLAQRRRRRAMKKILVANCYQSDKNLMTDTSRSERVRRDTTAEAALAELQV